MTPANLAASLEAIRARYPGDDPLDALARRVVDEVGEALRQASDSRAASSPEPVAWRYRYRGGMWKYVDAPDEVNHMDSYESEPLFATAHCCLAKGCSRRTRNEHGYCFQHADMAQRDQSPSGEGG